MTSETFRTERDTLGDIPVPAGAYWGAQTQRAIENFKISGLHAHPALILAMVMVKKACVQANRSLGKIDEKLAAAIEQASDDVLGGALYKQWVVDVYQAGAGTSFNMNTNEVLANRANEILGAPLGSYAPVHPNDHVNMSQSTNDTFPTAMQVATVLVSRELLAAMNYVADALCDKGVEFDAVLKSGRTHLQDAVPIRLGQEFAAYAGAIRRSTENLERLLDFCKELPLGGSATGTGLNTHPRFAEIAVRNLGAISGILLRPAADLRLAMQSMAPMGGVSSALRCLALELTRIANDIRLLASGPRTGFAEIILPAVQPGSSIMPDKYNPSMAECLNMVCMQVIGNDAAVAMAVQAGQLELNVMMPVIAQNVLFSMELLKNYLPIFTDKCVKGMKADTDRCRHYFESSVGLATILNEYVGYAKAAEIARESVQTRKTLRQLILEKGLMTEAELDRILDPKRITEPHDPKTE